MPERKYFPSLTEIRQCDRLLLHSGGRFLCIEQERVLFELQDVTALLHAEHQCFLVSEQPGCNILAVDVAEDIPDKMGGELRSLRSLLYLGDERQVSLAGSAFHILDWYRTHRYCGACGSENVFHGNERIMQCPRCSLQSFPRINPCVIMLVTRGTEMLLAQSALRKTGFYSCLAGFIEVGETPEQTIIREVREEVGIEVSNPRYIKSQPWPFPSQLMLGFRAEYAGGEIEPDREEIADARWFSVHDYPETPNAKISVAGELIEGFVAEVKGGRL